MLSRLRKAISSLSWAPDTVNGAGACKKRVINVDGWICTKYPSVAEVTSLHKIHSGRCTFSFSTDSVFAFLPSFSAALFKLFLNDSACLCMNSIARFCAASFLSCISFSRSSWADKGAASLSPLSSPLFFSDESTETSRESGLTWLLSALATRKCELDELEEKTSVKSTPTPFKTSCTLVLPRHQCCCRTHSNPGGALKACREPFEDAECRVPMATSKRVSH
mmetsp:Transcript_11984/g.19499  ORF Transcript_11984/g.19499 Transcript_11984/m.19499 type:complete len:222 (-) Transcript_11984:1543-2208(-)